eukprot:3498426-Prymnesium_polylepis.1
MSFTDVRARDATAETEVVLEHLLYHPNTAPFIAHRLIQRLTTSNPSPRYLGVVSTAFRTGTYGGKAFGGYGSLGAT